MKVPPKRKGNLSILNLVAYSPAALNESPSEKEGKLKKGGSPATGHFPQ